MCGIAGIFAETKPDPDRLARMLAAIGYRGPDARVQQTIAAANGNWLAVGQVRLAILDPRPEANQPFFTADQKASLTFNGEFYNFRRLRQRLESEGLSFSTRSDTEVALALLYRDGTAALPQLEGMFAGAYFHSETGVLELFRDRFGKKPLYVFPNGSELLFASEPKAILAALDWTPKIEPEALRNYLYLGFVPDDFCVFAGMFKLAAGHRLRAKSPRAYEIARWYQPARTEPDESRIEPLFLGAVADRMISDVPLAALLSGGLDSSLVVAAMKRQTEKQISTFSVRFAGPQAFDESPYARLVARHFGTDHHEVVLDEQLLCQTVPEILAHMDEPFGDSSAVPMFLVSREARRHFTVVLSGDGADEVFAGYRKYLGEAYLRKLGPYQLRRLLRPLLGLVPSGRSNRLLETGRRLHRLLRGDAEHAAQRHVNWLKMSPLDESDLLGPGLSVQGFEPVLTRLTQKLPLEADLNDCLRFDQELVLRDDMFVKVDRMSMKASIEVRSPFVDHKLVELANALPPERKLGGGLRKRVLIERLGPMLPPEILHRPKSGFEMPLGVWLRGPLRNLCESLLFDTKASADWVNLTRLAELWRIHLSGRLDLTETIWFHIVLAAWLKRYYP